MFKLINKKGIFNLYFRWRIVFISLYFNRGCFVIKDFILSKIIRIRVNIQRQVCLRDLLLKKECLILKIGCKYIIKKSYE